MRTLPSDDIFCPFLNQVIVGIGIPLTLQLSDASLEPAISVIFLGVAISMTGSA